MLSLSNLPDAIINRPRYDRSETQAKIVHLGFGAFHRAHQALFTDRLLNTFKSRWAICAVNIVGGEQLIREIRQQDNLYTVFEKGASSQTCFIIGSIKETLHESIDGIEVILQKMANSEVEIVSLTVTEKGYCLLPGGTGLDLHNPLISADLANPTSPKSAPGIIVEALARRMNLGIAAFTVLSCDNMPQNGKALKMAVLQLAKARDPKLADWIENNATFPCTMVDRIVPAATPESLTEIAMQLGGMFDPCAIACEPFIQWVIEDDFVTARPNWDQVGAQFVNDVEPYEEMKLRMLNGSHSFLAYLGYLAGYQHINECMNDKHFKKATLQLMMEQQAPTLCLPKEVDLKQYADKLIERFSNPSLKHKTGQIAQDGTQKLPQRLLDSIRWHSQHKTNYWLLALGVAAWIRYIGGVDDAGNPIEIRDPMANELALIVKKTPDGEQRVAEIMKLSVLFGADLSTDDKFKQCVTEQYLSLMKQGAKKTIENLYVN